MIGSADYSIKMPLSEVFLTALVGLVTVILILSIIAVSIVIISKIIRTIEDSSGKRNKKSQKTAAKPVDDAPKGTPLAESQSIGSLELIGTDETTAALIMAVVSDKSGIPLNRLEFKSIRLLED